MAKELSENQKKLVEEMVRRRMKNTGESRSQAVAFVTSYLGRYATLIYKNPKKNDQKNG